MIQSADKPRKTSPSSEPPPPRQDQSTGSNAVERGVDNPPSDAEAFAEFDGDEDQTGYFFDERQDDEEQIRIFAYALWEDEGRPDGRELDHWHRAKAHYQQTTQQSDRNE